jgi:hypothetical protein
MLSREVAALTLRQENIVNVYPPKVDEAIKDVAERDKAIEEKGRIVVAVEAAEFSASAMGVSAPSAERAVLEAEVVRLWITLERVVPMRRRDAPYWFRVNPQAADWYLLYQRDIEAFRVLRNTVVHEPGNLTDDDVRQGVELGRRLIASYRKFIDQT